MQIILKFICVIIFTCAIQNLNAQQKHYKEYYNNGNIKTIGFQTKQGTNVGQWTYYRENGTIDMELNFNEKGQPKGPFKMYFPNGQLQTKSSYSGQGFYEMDGDYISYYKNGQLESLGAYKLNNPIGKWVNYYSNGQLKSRERFTNEGIIQKNKIYYKNGELKRKARFNKKGDFIGKVITYYPNGSVFIKEEFDRLGHKTGTYKSYFENGNLMEIGDYAGVNYFQKKGPWKTFYSNGQLKTQITYNNKGDRVGEVLTYKMNAIKNTKK